MKPTGQITPATHTDGRGMLLANGRTDCSQSRRRNDLGLEIAANVLSDEAIGALLDEWIVPVIVDNIIRDLHEEGGHEEDPVQLCAVSANEGNQT